MSVDLASTVLIVLAAGQSSRFGSPKGLQRLNGKLFIEWQIERYRAAGGDRAIVVIGFGQEEYRERLAGVDLALAINPDPARGIFSSLQCGLGPALGTDVEALFVLPVDVPAPLPQIWRALAAEPRSLDVVQPVFGHRGGHPVRLSPRFATELLQVDPETQGSRLDHQIRELPPGQVVRLPVDDEGITMNLNTPDAWRSFELQLDKAAASPNI